MRKITMLGACAAVLLMSFTVVESYQVKKSTGEVLQEDGIYVFVDASPVKSSVLLGSVNVGSTFSWSEKYQDLKKRVLKKARKEFPGCECVVLRFDGGGVTASAYRFE